MKEALIDNMLQIKRTIIQKSGLPVRAATRTVPDVVTRTPSNSRLFGLDAGRDPVRPPRRAAASAGIEREGKKKQRERGTRLRFGPGPSTSLHPIHPTHVSLSSNPQV
jgi:hypothetical protein